MFGFSGAGLAKIRHMQNGGKRARHSIDQWDRQSAYTSVGARALAHMIGSDGSGQEVDRIFTRAIGQGGRTSRFRTEQSLAGKRRCPYGSHPFVDSKQAEKRML